MSRQDDGLFLADVLANLLGAFLRGQSEQATDVDCVTFAEVLADDVDCFVEDDAGCGFFDAGALADGINEVIIYKITL